MQAASPILIVALGDSTTAGTPGFLSPLESPPTGRGNIESQFAFWLERAHPAWRVLNRGVNGERTDRIRARFDRDVRQARPDAVIIIAGVNDVYQGKSAERVKRNLGWMYDRARAAGVTVIAGSILPYNTATAEQNATIRAINAWIRETAARGPTIAFCDTRAAVADVRNPDRLASSPDGLHPSPEGYRAMADALAPVVERVLQREASTFGEPQGSPYDRRT